MNITPITLEVFKNKFASVAEEMGMALTRAAFSPNIKERRDFSCAVFDANGDMVAQAAHIPVHLGSMPLSVAAVINAVPLGPGDMAMLNNPFQGGTHLPDITLVAPVYAGTDAPLFYVASRAHHADVGGMAPGSMPLSTSIFQEGLVIPPVKIVAEGEIVQGVMDLFLANVRTPQERQGDFAAQIMANRVGVARMEALVAAYGREAVTAMSAALMDYAERLMRAAIAAIPEGSYEAEDFLDDDGAGNADLAIRLTLSLADGEAELDFTDSDPQTAGCVNAVRAIAVSAALYALRALAGGEMPTNAGCMRPVTVATKAGTLVDAKFPAAVAGGNVETSQRIVDVILAALAKALPGAIRQTTIRIGLPGTATQTARISLGERAAHPPIPRKTVAVPVAVPAAPRALAWLWIPPTAAALLLAAVGGVVLLRHRPAAPAEPPAAEESPWLDGSTVVENVITTWPATIAPERRPLVQKYYEQLRELDGPHWGSIGAILETLAAIQFNAALDTNAFKTLCNLTYHDDTGRALGELDVVIWNVRENRAEVVYEAAVSDQIHRKATSSRNQIQRFATAVQKRQVAKILNPYDDRWTFDQAQFDKARIEILGNHGAIAAGFDAEVDITRAEADFLQSKIVAYRKVSGPRSPFLRD